MRSTVSELASCLLQAALGHISAQHIDDLAKKFGFSAPQLGKLRDQIIAFQGLKVSPADNHFLRAATQNFDMDTYLF